ncbi:MAG: PPE family protein, partial [Mycobacterium sp.]|nr:PPE family protein [Mycobacterium sp.]
DFGMLPPEINSGRMYTGPGAGPMLAAATAWDGLAAQLQSTAASYSSVISGLAAGWQGPSSAAMAAAAAPYTAWMSATATRAEQTAAQAGAAAAAYETAFAATVPPPIIAANRALLMSLIATNFLGQNTPAIAATEAHYAEMWAQDAAAMFGYAGSSAAASHLTPFTKPPQTTNQAGAASQAAAVAQASGTAADHAQTLSTLAELVQGMAAPTTPADPLSLDSILSSLTGPFSPLAVSSFGLSGYLLSTEPYGLASVGSSVAGLTQKVSALPSAASGGLLDGGLGSGSRLVGSTAAVSAGTGQAGVVGRLSVPPGWASAAPGIRPVAVVSPETSLSAVAAAVAADNQGSVFSNMALSTLAGRAMVDTGGTAPRSLGVGGGAYSGPAPTTSVIVILPDE